MSQDKDALIDRIDEMEAHGNTSTDIGIKWGAYFLDPASRTVLNNITGDGEVDSAFDDRPAAYEADTGDETDTIKIMVVMTDGVNTTQYTLDNDYDDELSDVVFQTNSPWMSVPNVSGGGFYNSLPYQRNPDRTEPIYDALVDEGYFYRTNGGSVRGYRRGTSAPQEYFNGNVTVLSDLTTSSADNPYRLSWRETWELMGVKYYAYMLQYYQTFNSNHYFDFIDDALDEVSGNEKDDRMQDICEMAKSQGVVIYTIGFEVTDSSAAKMSDCATSTNDDGGESSNFFRVEGNGLGDAFNQIAKTIQRLKLTS